MPMALFKGFDIISTNISSLTGFKKNQRYSEYTLFIVTTKAHRRCEFSASLRLIFFLQNLFCIQDNRRIFCTTGPNNQFSIWRS